MALKAVKMQSCGFVYVPLGRGDVETMDLEHEEPVGTQTCCPPLEVFCEALKGLRRRDQAPRRGVHVSRVCLGGKSSRCGQWSWYSDDVRHLVVDKRAHVQHIVPMNLETGFKSILEWSRGAQITGHGRVWYTRSRKRV